MDNQYRWPPEGERAEESNGPDLEEVGIDEYDMEADGDWEDEEPFVEPGSDQEKALFFVLGAAVLYFLMSRKPPEPAEMRAQALQLQSDFRT